MWTIDRYAVLRQSCLYGWLHSCFDLKRPPWKTENNIAQLKSRWNTVFSCTGRQTYYTESHTHISCCINPFLVNQTMRKFQNWSFHEWSCQLFIFSPNYSWYSFRVLDARLVESMVRRVILENWEISVMVLLNWKGKYRDYLASWYKCNYQYVTLYAIVLTQNINLRFIIF